MTGYVPQCPMAKPLGPPHSVYLGCRSSWKFGSEDYSFRPTRREDPPGHTPPQHAPHHLHTRPSPGSLQQRSGSRHGGAPACPWRTSTHRLPHTERILRGMHLHNVLLTTFARAQPRILTAEERIASWGRTCVPVAHEHTLMPHAERILQGTHLGRSGSFGERHYCSEGGAAQRS